METLETTLQLSAMDTEDRRSDLFEPDRIADENRLVDALVLTRTMTSRLEGTSHGSGPEAR